jgi:hypothetical protein
MSVAGPARLKVARGEYAQLGVGHVQEHLAFEPPSAYWQPVILTVSDSQRRPAPATSLRKSGA